MHRGCIRFCRKNPRWYCSMKQGRTESTHFDLWFNLILLILIRFDFDSSWITIQPEILIHLRIKNQIESKITGRWIVIDSFPNHGLVRFPIKSEAKWIAIQFFIHRIASPKGHSGEFLDKIFFLKFAVFLKKRKIILRL